MNREGRSLQADGAFHPYMPFGRLFYSLLPGLSPWQTRSIARHRSQDATYPSPASPSSIFLSIFSIFLLSNGNHIGYKNGLKSNRLSSGV